MIAPAIEPDTLVVDQDLDFNMADTAPGIAAIESGGEDLTGSVLWDF